MSPEARKVWESIVIGLTRAGVLRTVDHDALGQYCEDRAQLNQLRRCLKEWTAEVDFQNKQAYDLKVAAGETPRKPLSGFLEIARSTEGKRIQSAINEIAGRCIVQRREFGLTPSSSTRIAAQKMESADPLEEMCG